MTRSPTSSPTSWRPSGAAAPSTASRASTRRGGSRSRRVRKHRQDRSGWVRALYDPVVGRALALIHDDPARPWSVEMLARAVGTPRATFSRRFAALTGQSSMAYVTAWRMSVAARLLREEQASLRAVARSVGYDSEFAFARAFKRIVGRPRAATALTPRSPGHPHKQRGRRQGAGDRPINLQSARRLRARRRRRCRAHPGTGLARTTAGACCRPAPAPRSADRTTAAAC